MTFLRQTQKLLQLLLFELYYTANTGEEHNLYNGTVNFCIFYFFKSIVSMIVPCTLEQRQARRAPSMPYDQSTQFKIFNILLIFHFHIYFYMYSRKERQVVCRPAELLRCQLICQLSICAPARRHYTQDSVQVQRSLVVP